MPDLLTHFLAAYLLVQVIGVKKYASIIYVGAILPDILSRPFIAAYGELYWFLVPIHTPVVMILACLLFVYFFAEENRKRICIYLLAGVSLHFFMDIFQKHIRVGYFWFFPFSWTGFEVGLFWPEESIYCIPVLLGLIVLHWLYRRQDYVRGGGLRAKGKGLRGG